MSAKCFFYCTQRHDINPEFEGGERESKRRHFAHKDRWDPVPFLKKIKFKGGRIILEPSSLLYHPFGCGTICYWFIWFISMFLLVSCDATHFNIPLNVVPFQTHSLSSHPPFPPSPLAFPTTWCRCCFIWRFTFIFRLANRLKQFKCGIIHSLLIQSSGRNVF